MIGTMKITKKLIEKYIHEYLDRRNDCVMKRNWSMMMIHRLQCDRRDENGVNCSKRWIKHIEGMLDDLRKLNDFDTLYNAVKKEADTFYGIGKLSTYDTATCIGFEQGVLPDKVYLHAGAAEGAKALGIRGSKAEKGQFVAICNAFEALEPAQIEDFLCIYKKQLQGKTTDSPKNGGCGC